MDGETYLRLEVEQLIREFTDGVLEPQALGRRLATLHHVKTALVAAEALADGVGDAIVADLHLGLAVRGAAVPDGLDLPMTGARGMGRPIGQSAPLDRAFANRSVRRCEVALDSADGRVRWHYLVAAGDGADLVATAESAAGHGQLVPPSASPPGAAAGGALSVVAIHRRISSVNAIGGSAAQPAVSRQRPPGYPSFASDISLTDDAGGEYVVHQGTAGGNGQRWELRLRVRPAPPPSVRALIVSRPGAADVRVELAPPADCEVGPVSPRPEGERGTRAERFLVANAELALRSWRQGGVSGASWTIGRDAAAARALVAVGAVDPASRVLDIIDALARAREGEEWPVGLPESWGLVLDALAETGGPEATVVVGASLPTLEGQRVWLDALVSSATGWHVDSFVTPWAWQGRGSGAGGEALSIVAVDDRGGHYIGFVGSASGGSEGAQVRFTIMPRLDPAASGVAVTVRTPTESATVSVRLPAPWGVA